MSIPAYTTVIETLEKILNNEKYKGVKIDEVSPKDAKTITLTLSIKAVNFDQKWAFCDDIAEILNDALSIIGKPRYKCMSCTNSATKFYLHYVDLY